MSKHATRRPKPGQYWSGNKARRGPPAIDSAVRASQYTKKIVSATGKSAASPFKNVLRNRRIASPRTDERFGLQYDRNAPDATSRSPETLLTLRTSQRLGRTRYLGTFSRGPRRARAQASLRETFFHTACALRGR